MKVQMIAGALALAMAGTAGAAIEKGISDNGGELFLTVWDATNSVSYTRDLNITMDTMETSTFEQVTADAAFNAAFNGVDPSTLVYNVVALTQADTNNGANLPSLSPGQNNGIMTTSNDVSVSLNEIGFNNVQTGVGGWVNSVNSALGANDSVQSAGGDPSAFDNAGMGTNLAGFAGFNTTASVGQSLAFHWIEMDIDLNQGTFPVSSSTLAGLWTLDANGTLTYSTGSVNPVPVPAAAWLFMSGLMGAVGVARRRKA